jgi:periplasmic protein TonB
MTKYYDQLAVQLAPDEPETFDSSIRLKSAPLAKPPSVPRQKRWELAAILGISTLLHASGAVMAMTAEHTPKLQTRGPQKVQIQVARPKVEKPVVPPPTPPKPVEPLRTPPKQRLEPVAKPTPTPVPEAAPQEVPEVVDTGSDLPAAADGTLFAGNGGLGVAPPPPPAPPAPPEPAKPAPVIQAREGANYLKNPRPGYPGVAQRNGWQGTTLLRVQVTPKGKPAAIAIHRSSGKDVLDEAAINAVKKWSFVPATQGGLAVGGVVTVPIVFRLQ